MEKHKAKHGEGDCTAIWRLRQMFQVLDLDHDSTVDINEFQQAIGKLGLGLTPRDVQMLFLAVDSNSDGSLKAAEFVDAVRGGTIAERRRALLDEAFQKLDKSGDQFRAFLVQFPVRSGGISADFWCDFRLEWWDFRRVLV